MSELSKQDLQAIERQLGRIADALERTSPPPPKEAPAEEKKKRRPQIPRRIR